MQFLKSILPSFPLLGKELVEQAGRKRTYVIRVILLMFFAAIGLASCFHFYTFPGWRSGYSVALGGWPSYIGTQMFYSVVYCQFFAVLACLPAIMGGVISGEKERNTLELLFLTRMRPYQIILQKYLSRIIPMLSFLLIGLPILAVAYSMGGVGSDQLSQIAVMTIVSMFEIGAYSIMFSAYFSTTAAAVTASYLLTALQFLIIYFLVLEQKGRFVSVPRSGYESFSGLMILLAVLTFVSLGMSIRFLKTRPFTSEKVPILNYLKRLDLFWKRINRTFYGVEFNLGSEGKMELPGRSENPLQWYDRAKSAAGRLHNKLRIVVFLFALLMIPTMFELYWGSGYRDYGAMFMKFYLAAASVALSIRSALAIPSERGGQALDILLATPLKAEDIVRYKMRGVNRLILVFSAPVILFMLIIAPLGGGSMGLGREFFGMGNELMQMGFILVYSMGYMLAANWLSCFVGLRARNQTNAILIALSVLAAWHLVPMLLGLVFANIFGPFMVAFLTNPALYFFGIHGRTPKDYIVVSYVFNLWVFSMVFFYFRWKCITGAEVFLRNAPTRIDPEKLIRGAAGI